MRAFAYLYLLYLSFLCAHKKKRYKERKNIHYIIFIYPTEIK